MTMPTWLRLSWRLFRHELSRGELTIVFLAIVLSVATVFSLSGFSVALKSALIKESTSFIAADRVLATSRPANVQWLTKADEFKLQQAQQVLLTSMVFAGDEMVLADIKAVSQAYPLRGELLIVKANEINATAQHSPKSGEVWVEPALLNKLKIKVGDNIEVGVRQFKVSGVVDAIPDASFSVFTQGPTIIVSLEDLPSTGLIQPGSRVTYRYLFAGEPAAIASYSKWLEPKVNDTQRWYDIKSRQSPLAKALNRAERFLKLASMLGIVLACIAVSVAARRYGQRHESTVAVLKALGFNKVNIRKIYTSHWLILSKLSFMVGLLTGGVILYIGIDAMAGFGLEFRFAQLWSPLFTAFLTAIISIIAFCLVPLINLINVKALHVIRLQSLVHARAKLQITVAVAALLVLLMIFSGSFVLTASILIASLVIILIILLIAKLVLSLGRKMGSGAGNALQLAVANIRKRASANSIQLVSFTLAMQLLLILLVVKNQLIADWQAQLPDNTPNRFLVNIAKTELDDIRQFVQENHIYASDLYAVVRGRLAAINNDVLTKESTKEQTKAADNGNRLGIGRELNLTWRAVKPEDDKIVAGAFWQRESSEPQVSVEQGIAKRLDIKVGDTLHFTIGTDKIAVPVTSIRKVNWNSMKPNFFMIFSPAVLKQYPASYFLSLNIAQSQQALLNKLMAKHPTMSVIDVDAMIHQLKQVISQVTLAIQFILIVVVIAGALVLVAQVQASMEEREREIAILRTLGAKGKLLRNSVWLEFLLQGALAGIIAGITMEIATYFIQTRLFKMTWVFHGEYWLLALFCGAAFVGSLGALSCARLLKMTSVDLIRRTM